VACSGEDTLNEKPVIAYESYTVEQDSTGKDNLIRVKITYEDGNGDLGYRESDTTGAFMLGAPYFYNLHVDFYSIENGNKVYYLDQFSGDTINFNQRIQSITPEGKYKAISGTMDISIDFTLLKVYGYSPNNCQMDIWINDRSLNESNRVNTPVVDLNL